MTASKSKTRFSFLHDAAVAVALMTVCAAASAALPAFTLNPSAAGLNGAAINADNILVSDFSTVVIDPAGTFTESGYLSISGFQLGGATLTPAGA